MGKWKTTEHKRTHGYTELKVVCLVKEIATYDWVTYASAFEGAFQSRIIEIKAKNAVLPSHSYRITTRNETSVELWKMKTNGDFNYKILTLAYEPRNF